MQLRAVWTAGVVILGLFLTSSANGQVESIPGAPSGGIGAAGAAGSIGGATLPSPPQGLSTNSLSVPDLRVPNISAPQGTATAPAASPAEPNAEPAAQASPPRAPLVSAFGKTEDESGRCEITSSARESCSGPDCLLSCAADTCPGQENATCEFVIDCAAEIVSDIASGDQQCDDATIEHTTVGNDGIAIAVSIVRLPAGQSCEPPPCAK
jgi:hypothetical protein